MKPNPGTDAITTLEWVVLIDTKWPDVRLFRSKADALDCRDRYRHARMFPVQIVLGDEVTP